MVYEISRWANIDSHFPSFLSGKNKEKMVKVIGASFPKTGTKSLWRALVYLGYNHFESPNWVDRMLDDWVSFMKVCHSFILFESL